jgi:hypothetical protein
MMRISSPIKRYTIKVLLRINRFMPSPRIYILGIPEKGEN